MRERSIGPCTLPHVKEIDSQWEFAVSCRELSLVLCDNPEGWDADVGGRLWREGVYVYIHFIHCTGETNTAS